MDLKNLTQENLNRFLSLHPDNPELQAITLDALRKHAEGKDPAGSDAQPATLIAAPLPGVAMPTPCQIAVAGLVVDCVLVVAGFVGLHGRISSRAVEEVAIIVEPQVSQIVRLATIIANPDSTKTEIAKAIFSIVKLVYTVGMLEAIVKAIWNSLTPWDAALYGTLALAELVAVLATDGVATIALIVAELAQIGFVISDAFKVKNACG